VTTVKNGSETTSSRQFLHHNIMHFLSHQIQMFGDGGLNVIDDWSSLVKVDRVDCLVIHIILRTIEIDHLSSVATVMEEKTVMWSCIVDEPMHRTNHVGFGRDHGLLRRIIVSENHHVVI